MHLPFVIWIHASLVNPIEVQVKYWIYLESNAKHPGIAINYLYVVVGLALYNVYNPTWIPCAWTAIFKIYYIFYQQLSFKCKLKLRHFLIPMLNCLKLVLWHRQNQWLHMFHSKDSRILEHLSKHQRLDWLNKKLILCISFDSILKIYLIF